MKKPTTVCPECGAKTDFAMSQHTPYAIPDGRLKANEVSAVAVLGCPECGETLRVFHEHEIIQVMNEWLHS